MSIGRRAFLSGAAAISGAASLAAAAEPADDLAPPKVLIPGMPPEQLTFLREAAPGVELVICPGPAEASSQHGDAHATYGIASPEMIASMKSLRWIQWPSAGVEGVLAMPGLVESSITLTNMQRIYGPEIADQAMGYLLAHTRQLDRAVRTNPQHEWAPPPEAELGELGGQTMLIVGLGGIGSEIARRAHGFGMTVVATDPKVIERPLFVSELHKPEALDDLLPRADVVVSAAPHTPKTDRLFNAARFARMKRGVVFLNVSRGKLVETDSLVAALDRGQVAFAGLDVTDPEPLPKGHPLWSRRVIITPHSAGQSPAGRVRALRLFAENLGRFGRGESLLNVVDKRAGY